jgi:SAM-dependent methyltransferase
LSGETLDRGHFDGLYDQSPDPYGFTSRWYETRKYALSLAMLPWPRYRRAFEPGCSIGVLTAQLAGRCDSLLSCDGSAAAVATARERTAQFPQVTVEQRLVPADWPAAEFDLIVLSELLYYLSDEDLARTTGLAVDSLAGGGTLLAVHWRRPVPFHPQTGDGVHAALAARPELALLADHREPDFLAQVYLRAAAGTDPGTLSVAAREGLT